MNTALKFLLLAALFAASQFTAFAQDSQGSYKPTGVYNLKFVVSEIENGKVTNQRTYTAIVREERKSTLRTGNRVPIVVGSFGPSGTASPQIQYLDVGFNADTTVSERDGRIDLDVEADLSSILPADGPSTTPGNNPVMRQMKQHLSSAVVDGKATVITSMDDVNSKKTVQLEVTITKIKKSAM